MLSQDEGPLAAALNPPHRGQARVRGAHVLVAPDVDPEQTEGGIIRPEAARETQHRGTVMLVGDVPDLAPGDRVLFGQFAGTPLVHEGTPCVFLRATDVLMVLAPEAVDG